MLAGTTGEGATLTDDEKVRLWEIGVAEAGGAPIIAGTGSNDTRHTVELTERAQEAGRERGAGGHAVLQQAQPGGPAWRTSRPSRQSTDLPVVLYNIPSRSVIDMPNDLLAELAEIPNVVAVKQARYEDLAPIDGLDLLAGNDDVLAEGARHGRHRRHPGGVAPGRARDAPDRRRARGPRRRSRRRSRRCSRRSPWRRWRPR